MSSPKVSRGGEDTPSDLAGMAQHGRPVRHEFLGHAGHRHGRVFHLPAGTPRTRLCPHNLFPEFRPRGVGLVPRALSQKGFYPFDWFLKLEAHSLNYAILIFRETFFSFLASSGFSMTLSGVMMISSDSPDSRASSHLRTYSATIASQKFFKISA